MRRLEFSRHEGLSRKRLAEIAAVIRAGGVVVYPTETLYALGGNALDAGLCRRLSALKKREPGKPFPLIANTAAARDRVAAEWPENAARLAARYWPGPLTLILPGRKGLPEAIRDERCGVALRHSPHPLLEALAPRLELPLIATSANFSGRPPAAGVKELDPGLLATIDLLLVDIDGPLPQSTDTKPSTIVDLRFQPPRIVRAGALEIPELERCDEKI